MGAVIAEIYEGIRVGIFNTNSDFANVDKRPHQSVDEMINEFCITK